jgi:signal peptidase I
MRSIRKSRNILHQCHSAWKKKSDRLSQGKRDEIEQTLRELDQAVQRGDREEADRLATIAEGKIGEHLPSTFWDSAKELLIAIVFALIVATVLRQMWFEFYEIPTGSMRPTFKEQDHLLVTKTSYGINIPLQANQFYFDPTLVNRTAIVIFTGENLDLPDTDALYFGIFPTKKRYIKRLIGKPNDTLWFYGGQIYGLDAEGKEITTWRDADYMSELEYIPFSRFEGRTSSNPSLGSKGGFDIFLRHFNIPVAKISFSPDGSSIPQLFVNGKWVSEGDLHYYDFFGMNDFAQVRLLTKEQLESVAGVAKQEIPNTSGEESSYYLEMRHHPILKGATLLQTSYGMIFPVLKTEQSILPIPERVVTELQQGLYTARFVVKGGLATRYNVVQQEPGRESPRLEGVPDGTYEFYYGKGYEIGFMGKATPIGSDHPLYARKNFQTLFNAGIELNDSFTQLGSNLFLPSRYAYYRNGDFYVMGKKILENGDPILVNFIAAEKSKQASIDYVPFLDVGAPRFDAEWKEKWGEQALHIPEESYVALGDNHAMSGDSRYFGFVPQQNLQGSPLIKIWPEVAVPRQPPIAWLKFPSVMVWGMMSLLIGGLVIYFTKKRRRPLFVEGT